MMRTFAGLAALVLLTVSANAAPIPISAMVGGLGVTEIGAITLSTDGKTFRARFDFANDKLGRGLDDWYDFRWVQIVAGITDDGTALTEIAALGKLPAIDPPPVDQGAAEKRKGSADPFYYNSDEWASGKFGKETIREERKFSMLSDSPGGHPDKRVIDFETYLVAQDLTAGKFKGKTFSVLAGFKWQFFGKGADKDGEAKAGAQITPINAAVLKGINDAMGRASVGGTFKGWEARTGETLYLCVPEPSTFLFAGTALLLLIPRRGRR